MPNILQLLNELRIDTQINNVETKQQIINFQYHSDPQQVVEFFKLINNDEEIQLFEEFFRKYFINFDPNASDELINNLKQIVQAYNYKLENKNQLLLRLFNLVPKSLPTSIIASLLSNDSKKYKEVTALIEIGIKINYEELNTHNSDEVASLLAYVAETGKGTLFIEQAIAGANYKFTRYILNAWVSTILSSKSDSIEQQSLVKLFSSTFMNEPSSRASIDSLIYTAAVIDDFSYLNKFFSIINLLNANKQNMIFLHFLKNYSKYTNKKIQNIQKSFPNLDDKSLYTLEAVVRASSSSLYENELRTFIIKGINEDCLFHNISKKQPQLINLLIKEGKDVSLYMHDWLDTIIERGMSDMYEIFYKKGLKANEQQMQRLLMNLLKIHLGYRDTQKLLVEAIFRCGANSNTITIEAIKFAIDTQMDPIIEIFINHGTPTTLIMTQVMQEKNMDLFKALIAKGYKIDPLECGQFLLAAISAQDSVVVASLLTTGIDLSFIQSEALSRAIDLPPPNFKIIACLIESGARLNEQQLQKLLLSALKDYIGLNENNRKLQIERIFSWGANLNTITVDAIKIVMAKRLDDILEIFIGKGVPPTLIMSLALQEKNLALFDKLIAKGYKIAILEGHRLLLRAIADGNLLFVVKLLTAGVDPKFNQSEVLKRAVDSPMPDDKIVAYLLETGAKANVDAYQLPFRALKKYYETENVVYLDMLAMLLINMGANKDRTKNLVQAMFTGNVLINDSYNIVKTLVATDFNGGKQLALSLAISNEIYNKSFGESAMSNFEQAKQHFLNVVMPKLKEIFNRYPGSSDIRKVEAIEREIKAFILDAMTETENKELREFVKVNKDLLIAADPHATAKMRTLAIANNEVAQVAWRAYDIQSSSEEYPCLLSPYYSEHSNDIRTRVAYCFIAEPQPTKENFLEQIAGMLRGNSTETGPDVASCYPGAGGRAGEMLRNHPTLSMPPTRIEILKRSFDARAITVFSEELKKCQPDKRDKLYYALIMLTSLNVEDILNDKVDYENELLQLRENFIKSLNTSQDFLKTIEQQLQLAGLPPFGHSGSDELFMQQAYLDIGGSGRAKQFLDRKLVLFPSTDETLAEEPAKLHNPYTIYPGSIPIILTTNQKRSIIQRKLIEYMEFELLFPLVQKKLNHVSLAKLIEITKNIINETISSDAFDNIDKVRLACQISLADPSLGLSSEQKQQLIEMIVPVSLHSGLDDKTIEEFEVHIQNKIKFKNAPDSEFNDMVDNAFKKICVTYSKDLNIQSQPKRKKFIP